MKTFINSRNLSGVQLCEIIKNAFPELYCSIDNEIFIHREEQDPAIIIISMKGNYGKVKVNIDSIYTEKIFEVIGHSLTENYDSTKSLVTFAERFDGITNLRIELINDNNLAIFINDEIALRLKLWLTRDGKVIEMQPFENEGGRILRNFIESDESFSAKLQTMRSGNLIKYISEVE
ncbi:hypothetical protein ACFOWA_10435 [Pedobacter lithocola]|uniref:Uncharacterized protein n=1 Tax=Pedobacter lithocola TaxID=1908239 RepID=A0ABV8PBJ2_9SPHI